MQTTQFTMKLLFTAALIILTGNIYAQVTFHITEFPNATPSKAEIFISGDFEAWSGGSENFKLTHYGDNTYAITLQQQSGSINFKFTRGSWASVEKGAQGEEISNRIYTFGGNGDTVEITILNWADSEHGTSTATENVSLMSDAFEMPQLGGRKRKIWLYLPPDYASSSSSYPVLYMHDGQNLFDDSTSFAGEWKVDETLNYLYEQNDIGLIVIGIENGGTERLNEYSPWINPDYGGGDGKDYIDFIVETLKPFVDENYRTLPGRENTGLMGSSLGGLISHYGGLAKPEIFGKTGVFSPSFWFSDSTYLFGHENAGLTDSKMYFLAGGMESAQTDVPASTQAMIDTMISGGFTQSNTILKVDADGTHSEAFWSVEFPDAIKWLFGDSTVSTNAITNQYQGLDFDVYPNPAHDSIHVVPPDLNQTYLLELFGPNGALVLDREITGLTSINIQRFGSGIYILKLSHGNSYAIAKIAFN
jgi:predicted alpha/beta superfamily hydrolase